MKGINKGRNQVNVENMEEIISGNIQWGVPQLFRI
jgi:hypothetical protein